MKTITPMNVKNGGASFAELTRYGSCYIAPTTEAESKIDAFYNEILTNPSRMVVCPPVATLDKTTGLVTERISGNKEISNFIEYCLDNDCTAFSGITEYKGDLIIFYTEATDLDCIGDDEWDEYAVCSAYNGRLFRAKYCEDKISCCMISGSVRINSSRLFGRLRKIEELPQPTVGFYNITGEQSYFNAATLFLLRIDGIRYNMHPDLLYIRNARKYYKQKKLPAGIPDWQTYQDLHINQKFNNGFLFTGRYHYIQKIIGGNVRSYLGHAGIPDPSTDLRHEADPHSTIIKPVLDLMLEDDTLRFREVTTNFKCQMCYTTKRTFSEKEVLAAEYMPNSSHEYDVEDILEQFSGVEFTVDEECTNCMLSTKQTKTETLKYEASCTKEIPILLKESLNARPDLFKLRNLVNLQLASEFFDVVAVVAFEGSECTSGTFVCFLRTNNIWHLIEDHLCTELTTAELEIEMDKFIPEYILLEEE